MDHRCEDCKSYAAELRTWWQDTAYGVYPHVICKDCLDKENASRRAESRRLHMRLSTIRWDRLEPIS